MTNLYKIHVLGLVLAFIVTSCSTSNDVVGNRNIQKRKYNDGYYISFNKKYRKDLKDENQANEIPVQEEITDIIESTEIPKIDPETNINDFEKIPEVEVEMTGGLVEVEKPNDAVDSKTEDLNNGHTATKELIFPQMTRQPFNQLIKKKLNIKHSIAEGTHGDGDVRLVLLVILAIILPPLAVFLYEGASNRFIVVLILWLIGWAFAGWIWSVGRGSLGALAALAAVIYALLIVLGVV